MHDLDDPIEEITQDGTPKLVHDPILRPALDDCVVFVTRYDAHNDLALRIGTNWSPSLFIYVTQGYNVSFLPGPRHATDPWSRCRPRSD